MRSVGVREFRDNATKLLAGGEELRVERHGHLVGYFVPAVDSEGNPAIVALADLLRDAIDSTDMTQEELVAVLRRAM